ncbi:Thioredoxin [Thelohanellus kitauei]|uniref:Thioredoxin n=1 Tax=Thelohanellus kitauei TaxID=669202 RepID=A0A0C2IWE4_THEKT|nr:Thioredoxin [Thelohanellus kitauei]
MIEEVTVPETKHRYVCTCFWASWCPSCSRLLPELERSRTEFLEFEFEMIDIDEFPDNIEQFDLFVLPTIIISIDNEMKTRLIGYSPELLTNALNVARQSIT